MTRLMSWLSPLLSCSQIAVDEKSGVTMCHRSCGRCDDWYCSSVCATAGDVSGIR